MTGYDVHIADMAALTAVGLTAEATAAAVRCGMSRVGDHPFMVDQDGEALRCGRVPSIPAELMGWERLVQLAKNALQPLLDRLTNVKRAPISVHLALPETRPGFDDLARRQVLRGLAARLPAAVFSECGRGHAGAVPGLQRALGAISSRREALCIVGGVDSYLNADTLDWLDADRRLARASRRGGFPPGEAAAFLVLANTTVQVGLQLSSEGVVGGAFCTNETRDETSPEGLLGEALGAAYRSAASVLGSSERFDDFYCDVNDERARGTDLGFALLRTGGLFRDGTGYTTVVPSVGDVGAASIPLGCALAARAWRRRYAHGPRAIVSAASWGGLRGAVLLRQPRD